MTACQHPAHEGGRIHGGPAVAVIHYHCPACGRDRITSVCQPYLDAVRDPDKRFHCRDCKTVFVGPELYSVVSTEVPA